MSRNLPIGIALWLASVSVAIAQPEKNIETREMGWIGYFNQSRFTNRSGLWADVHLRLNDNFVSETHAILARVAYIYYVTDRTRISAGYA